MQRIGAGVPVVIVLQIGNFGPAHSTEWELRKALGALGHDVAPCQENEPEVFVRAAQRLREYPRIGLVLWTRTGFDPPVPHDQQLAMLAAARNEGIPTVGAHLDRWIGLDREGQVDEEPYFRCEIMATADGGHDEDWARRGINHRWFPPGVSEFECGGGTFNRRLASDVAFVGSWRPGYHAEWQHRPQLIAFLRTTYRQRCRFWGGVGRSMRGPALRDLYASTKVNVGDSCLVGDATHYLSDRIPETLGRGGFLLHPNVEGVTDGTLYTDGEHLVTWQLGDWGELREKIDYYLAHDEERRAIAAAGRAHVLTEHTYTRRLERLFVDLGLAVSTR